MVHRMVENSVVRRADRKLKVGMMELPRAGSSPTELLRVD